MQTFRSKKTDIRLNIITAEENLLSNYKSFYQEFLSNVLYDDLLDCACIYVGVDEFYRNRVLYHITFARRKESLLSLAPC